MLGLVVGFSPLRIMVVLRLLSVLGLWLLSGQGAFGGAEGAGEPRTVRVAYFDYRPGIFRDENGMAAGFHVDLLELVAKERGWRLEYVYGSWSDGMERIQRGELDLLTSVAYTEERARYLDYCHQPLLTVWGELYLREDSPVRSVGTAQGLRVAVMKGDFNAASFRRLAEQMGLDCSYLEVEGFEAAFAAVRPIRRVQGLTVDCVAARQPVGC